MQVNYLKVIVLTVTSQYPYRVSPSSINITKIQQQPVVSMTFSKCSINLSTSQLNRRVCVVKTVGYLNNKLSLLWKWHCLQDCADHRATRSKVTQIILTRHLTNKPTKVNFIDFLHCSSGETLQRCPSDSTNSLI